MSLESDLYALLAGIVGRAFPDTAPFDTPMPYATYQQIGGDVVNYSDNSVPDAQNGFFQVNIWSPARSTAKSLMQQVEAALIAAPTLQARPQVAMRIDHEADLGRYGATQDFSIWADR